MKIRVPENMGGELKVLPEGTFEATLQDMFPGKSGSGNPKLTVKYVVTSESEGKIPGDPTTIGETVLETMSLQEQALWRLNDLYKQCTNERIPQGDYDEDTFVEMIKKGCIGAELFITLKVEEDNKGVKKTQVERRAPRLKAAVTKKFAKK